jgi:hypothetical protein
MKDCGGSFFLESVAILMGRLQHVPKGALLPVLYPSRREECADQCTEKELHSNMAQSNNAAAERAAQCGAVYGLSVDLVSPARAWLESVKYDSGRVSKLGGFATSISVDHAVCGWSRSKVLPLRWPVCQMLNAKLYGEVPAIGFFISRPQYLYNHVIISQFRYWYTTSSGCN